MGADVQDMINKLMIQQATPPQPSFAGLQAPTDPNNLAGVLQKLKQQQYLSGVGNDQTQGGYGYLHNAGQQALANVGQQLGAAAGTALTQPPPQAAQASPQAAMSQSIMQAKLAYASMIQNGVDPDTAKVNSLKMLVQTGVPGADDALSKAQADVLKNQGTKAETAKNTSQASMDAANIVNQQDEQKNRAATQSLETNKNTWSTVSETPQTVVQKNALGEVRVQQKMPASQAAAANVSPDAMQAMLDSYHTTGTVPTGLGRSPAMAGAFWQAESNYQQQTGNTAGSVLAAKASAKANTDALAQTQKQISSTTSYFDTMDKNIGNASALADKLNLSDQPTLNRAVAAYEKGTSDPDYAKYRVFFDSVANEYAKIKSGALGNAPVSDSARQEAQSILIPLMGANGVKAAFDAVKQEGQNRLDSLGAQRDSLVSRLTGKPPAATQPTQAPAAAPATPVSLDAYLKAQGH